MLGHSSHLPTHAKHKKCPMPPVDTSAALQQGPLMRLTINLDEDLYALALSHAIASKTHRP